MSVFSPIVSQAIGQCATNWLKALLRELLPQVVDVKDTPAGHEQAKQWDNEIKARMAARGLVSLNQQKNPITDVRRVLKAIDANHPALADVGFSSAEWTEINMPTEDAVAQRTAKPIDDPNEIARRASVLLESDAWSELAAGLAVVTGRRAAEVMQTAQFERASDWSVWFTGAVKRRGESVPLRFELPTLVAAHSVVEATLRLRSLLDTEGMSNREINRAYSHAIAQACDRTFSDVVPAREGKDNLYTHLFRSVYSTIATFWFCPPEVPELEFRAAVQGHFKVLEEGRTELRRSMAASRHYFDYEISDRVVVQHQGKRKGVRLGEPGVEVISAFSLNDDDELAVRDDVGDVGESVGVIGEERQRAMVRIGIYEGDKQRVLDLQDELGLATQQDTMQAVLDAADAAFSAAQLVDAQVIELPGEVEGILEGKQRLQARLAEAEKMAGQQGAHDIVEKSLAMAHEFNDHLKGENERLRGELKLAEQERDELKGHLAQLQTAQLQLQQLQQLLNGQLGQPTAAGASVAATTTDAIALKQPQKTATTTMSAPRQQTTTTATGSEQKVSALTNQPSTTTATQKAMGMTTDKEEESYSDQVEREVVLLVQEIMQYNDQQAADDSERWQVNQSTLKQLSSKNQSVIKRVLDGQLKQRLQDHHDKYGLHGRMANRGKDIEHLKTALGIIK